MSNAPPARPRALFFGTPEFAATILARLLQPDSPVTVVGVVTQPDKPVGRRHVLSPPPVKALVAAHGVPVLQPVSLRRPAAVAALARFRPDVGIVAAYGHILRPAVLAIPRLGHLNVHASLLPRWRGAWPIGAAILAGDAETGVTIMRLDEGMDTGPLLAARRTPIHAGDTTDTLERRLASLGAGLLVETLPSYAAGALTPYPQDDSQATYSRLIGKADGRIDWSQPAAQIERHVRAMTPWPGAFTSWGDKQLRVFESRLPTESERAALSSEATQRLSPGAVARVGKSAAVMTGDGLLVLDRVQLEGRPATPIAAFLNGHRDFVGSHLDTADRATGAA